MNPRLSKALLLALVAIAVLPAVAQAQSTIAGIVKDTTGAVLPGVTVEASSPALIEKTRTVTTDEAGQYRIVDLRPGSYVLTFTLPGFNTVKREGIELTANFTATINAELRVGSIEESVTVSGETPVVDVQSTTTQQVLTRALLDAVPSGRSIWALGSTLLGITLSAPDVGGTAGMQQTYMATHGSDRRDNAIQIDGMSVNGIEGDGAIQNYFNEAMFQEMAYQTGGLSAEVQSSGVRLNMIPKEGGNIFKGSLFTSLTPGGWQSNNYTEELRQKGLRSPNVVDHIHDFNPAFGGPLMRERLWFFSSWRWWAVDQGIADSFYNVDPTHRTYQPDLSSQVLDDNYIKSGVVRLTLQMAQKHKLAAYVDRIVKFRGHECTSRYAEEACGIRSPKRYFTAQAKYTGTWTNKLLFEAGWSENDETYSTNEPQPSVGPRDIPRFDRDTRVGWSAPNGPYYFRSPDRHTFSGSLSYVTGSHAFKTGFQLGRGGNRHQRRLQDGIDLIQEYRSGRPASVNVYNTPVWSAEGIKYDLGLYVQDSWTFKRLTLNPGFRVELFNTYVPAQVSPPGRFVPGREFAAIEDLPDWTDWAPRLGMAYNLFGDGKTAVKAHMGKYMRAFSTVGFAQVYNPLRQETDRRTWTDRDRLGRDLPTNGDDIAQENEIGPPNTTFNTTGALNRNPDPNIKRPYQWDYSVGIQREVVRRVSVSANWVRRDFRRLFWRDNLLLNPEDYRVIPFQNPINPSEIIPVYSLDPAKLGKVDELEKNSDNNRRWYNGFDFGFTARIGGGNIYGGAGIGRQMLVTCDVEDPNSLRFCDDRDWDIPYLTQFKLSGTYPLPLGAQISGTWQGYPGVPTGTNRQDAEVPSSLRVERELTPTSLPGLTQSQVTIQLIPPGSRYLKRWNQIDMRLAKKFDVRGVRLQGQFDIFNVTNSSSVLNEVETFGPTLGTPTAILQGRLFAIGLQANF